MGNDQRILTTHAGSLLRPPALVEMYVKRGRGEPIDEVELGNLIRQATRKVVERQLEAGIDIGNNGEQEREMYNLYIRRRLTGLGGSWKRPIRGDLKRYPEHAASIESSYKAAYAAITANPIAQGPIRYCGEDALREECEIFAEAMSTQIKRFVEPFLTAPTPGTVATSIKNEYYDNDEQYLDALAEALRAEYQTIVGRDWLLQLDATELAMERHYGYQDRPIREFLGYIEKCVDALNKAIDRISPTKIRLHVCWGNYEGPHDCDVPLADIWPIVKQAKVGAFMLTGANPRHQHELSILSKSPMRDDQILVIGVIDPLTNFVEHPELVAQRIERAAHSIGDATRVIAGTDCGFETGAGIGRVTSDVMWAKLRALRDGARIASQRLFGSH